MWPFPSLGVQQVARPTFLFLAELGWRTRIHVPMVVATLCLITGIRMELDVSLLVNTIRNRWRNHQLMDDDDEDDNDEDYENLDDDSSDDLMDLRSDDLNSIYTIYTTDDYNSSLEDYTDFYEEEDDVDDDDLDDERW